MVYSLLSFLRIKQKTEYNIALKNDMLGNYLDKFVFEVEHLVTFVATYDVCCFVVFSIKKNNNKVLFQSHHVC